MCAPLTAPIKYTIDITISAGATASMPFDTSPDTSAITAAPAPTNVNKKVPQHSANRARHLFSDLRKSANSFLFSSAMLFFQQTPTQFHVTFALILKFFLQLF